MATAAPLAGAEPKQLEKKPIKFSNLLCKARHLVFMGGIDTFYSGRRSEHV